MKVSCASWIKAGSSTKSIANNPSAAEPQPGDLADVYTKSTRLSDCVGFKPFKPFKPPNNPVNVWNDPLNFLNVVTGRRCVKCGACFINTIGGNQPWQHGGFSRREPSVYSYQQLVKDKKTVWDGVANNLALKNLRDIKKGEQVFIYHTGDEKAAVGVAKALSEAYPDPSKKDPKLLVVDVEPVRALPRPVTLAEVKAHPKLKNFDLVRNSRLSIMKVTDEQWEIMEGMAKEKISRH